MINSNPQNLLSLKELPGAILKNVLTPKKTSYNFTMKHEDFLRCRKEHSLLWYTLARVGIQKADVSYSSAGEFMIKNIILWSWPMYRVSSESDVISAVQEAKKNNAQTFGLLLEKDFYGICRRDSYIRESALLKGGLSSFDTVYHDDNLCACWYQKCRYLSLYIVEGALNQSAAQEVLSAGMEGKETIALMLDNASWDLTLRDKEYLSEWSARAGLKCLYVPRKEIRTYLFGTDNDAFLPAVRILASLKNGTEDNLPGKYKKALSAARMLIQNVSGSAIQMYAQIHDILCRKITYEINPKCEDNSSCIGALLNGKAKCDGYSDAFYLCCGIKKLPAAYMAGKSKIQRKYTDEDNHIWNLILLDGKWRGVDVTWDDIEKDIVYDFFNIGLDRIKPAYSFHDIMLPKNMLETTNTSESPIQEYPVSSENDMILAFRDMVNSGKDKITLRCSDSFFETFLQDSGLLWRSMARSGIKECDCTHRNNAIFISSPVKFPQWAYCIDKEAVSKAAEIIRGKNIKEVVLVFGQKLFKYFLKGSSMSPELFYLLALGGLDVEGYQYNESSCSITLSKMKILNAFTCKASTLGELRELIKNGFMSSEAVLDIWLSPVLFEQIMKDQQLLFSVMNDIGISREIAWSYNEHHSRIQIQTG